MYDFYFTCKLADDFAHDLLNYMSKHDVMIDVRQKIVSDADAYFGRPTEYISGRAIVPKDDWDEFRNMICKYTCVSEEVKDED